MNYDISWIVQVILSTMATDSCPVYSTKHLYGIVSPKFLVLRFLNHLIVQSSCLYLYWLEFRARIRQHCLQTDNSQGWYQQLRWNEVCGVKRGLTGFWPRILKYKTGFHDIYSKFALSLVGRDGRTGFEALCLPKKGTTGLAPSCIVIGLGW